MLVLHGTICMIQLIRPIWTCKLQNHNIFQHCVVVITTTTQHFLRHCGVVVITTAQLHSTKPKLRFCAASNPACSMSWFGVVRSLTMVLAGNKAKHLLSVNHIIKTIHHHHHHQNLYDTIFKRFSNLIIVGCRCGFKLSEF